MFALIQAGQKSGDKCLQTGRDDVSQILKICYLASDASLSKLRTRSYWIHIPSGAIIPKFGSITELSKSVLSFPE